MMSARMKAILVSLATLASSGIAAAHDMGQHDIFTAVMLDRFEVRNSNAGNSSYWEGQGWIGGDINKAWFKTQGDVAQGKARAADAQLLYSRAVEPYWDAQAGMRHDFALNSLPARDWLALAYKGLAPYKFDIDASLYFGKQGAAARIKSGYALLLTQRIALLPEIEVNAYSKNDAARGIGSGLASLDVSLRLRYEITREFAPYLGVTLANKYGNTANYARQVGDRAHDTFIVAGLRLWW